MLVLFLFLFNLTKLFLPQSGFNHGQMKNVLFGCSCDCIWNKNNDIAWFSVNMIFFNKVKCTQMQKYHIMIPTVILYTWNLWWYWWKGKVLKKRGLRKLDMKFLQWCMISQTRARYARLWTGNSYFWLTCRQDVIHIFSGLQPTGHLLALQLDCSNEESESTEAF